jgi:hypothetical protein
MLGLKIRFRRSALFKAKVVIVRQPFRAVGIFPDPLPESILQLLLLFAGRDRLRLVYGTFSFRVLIIGCGRTSVRRLLNQVRCAKARGAVRRGVAHGVVCGVVQLQSPGCDGFRVADLHGRGCHVQQLSNEVANV